MKNLKVLLRLVCHALCDDPNNGWEGDRFAQSLRLEGKITICFSVISKERSQNERLWQVLVICNQILLSRTIEKCIEIVKRIC